MSVSYIKKLQNEITLYEVSSDRKIPNDSYYVVVVTIDGLSGKKTEVLTKYAEELLTVVEGSSPTVTYVYPPHIYYLYSSVDEKNEHVHEGSHQQVCSEFSSIASIVTGVPSVTQIVELETKSQVMAYFCLKNFENTRNSIVVLSKEKVTRKDVSQYTIGESIDMFNQKTGSNWDKISSGLRYGVFIKGRDGARKYTSIALDFKEIDMLTALLF